MSPILWPDNDDDPYAAWESWYDTQRRSRWRAAGEVGVFLVWVGAVVLILGGFLFW